jgi:hypothetical protein
VTSSGNDPIDAVDAVNQLGALWSDDFDAYASGELTASQVTCVLCMCAPCRCPEFGTEAYFALVDWRHGKSGPVCPGCEGRGSGELCQVCGRYIPPTLR